tara:strand:- start:499 stop:873 length:375 start_codon:yes stop_codon:yes gene_type:complete
VASYTKTTPSSLADELVCVVSVGNQSENNITGSTSGKLYLVEVDNTENSDIPVFLNIADASSATAGTTVPDFRMNIPRGVKSTLLWSEGHEYSAGLCIWASTTSATSSPSGPDGNVIVKMLVTA